MPERRSTSGSTTLTLDKTADKAILQRKLLLWGLKPVEASLSDISDITIDTAVDRASGVEVCHTMLVMKDGKGWAFPAADKTEAETNAAAMRGLCDCRRDDQGPSVHHKNVATAASVSMK